MRDSVAQLNAHLGEKLVINLWKNPDGALFARSVEVIDKVSRVRFSFNAESAIYKVFNARAMQEIAGIVDRTGDRRGILAMPDLRIDLKDLVLEGCRVLVTAAQDGIENIMVRFVRYFGRVRSLFRDGFAHQDCLADTAVDQAVAALEKVYLPLRNFAVYLDDLIKNRSNLLGPEKTSFLRNVRNEIDDLNTASDVVVHYVNSQGAIRQDAAPRGHPLPRLDGAKGDQLISADDADDPAIRRGRRL